MGQKGVGYVRGIPGQTLPGLADDNTGLEGAGVVVVSIGLLQYRSSVTRT